MSDEKVVTTNATDNTTKEGPTMNHIDNPTAGENNAVETPTEIVVTIPATHENARWEGDTMVFGDGSAIPTEAAAPEGAAEVAATPTETPAAPVSKPHTKRHWGRHNRNKGKPHKDARPNPRKLLAADPRWDSLKEAFAEKRNIVVYVEDFAWKKSKDQGKPDLIVGYQIQFIPLDAEGQPLAGEPLPGFLPQSEMQTGIKQKAVLKKTLQVKIDDLKIEEDGVRFVVSRRKATTDERKTFIDGLVEGQEVSGKILGEHEHGYFVGLFVADFLPPVMQAWLSKGQVPFAEGTRTPLVLTEKQVITAKVREKAESKVALTMRAPKPEGEKTERSERPEGQRNQRRHEGSGEPRREQRRDRRDSRKTYDGPATVLVYSTESKPAEATSETPAKAKKPVVKTPTPARKKGDSISASNFQDFAALWHAKNGTAAVTEEPVATEAAPAAEEVTAEVATPAAETPTAE
jgi:hypothetical protein